MARAVGARITRFDAGAFTAFHGREGSAVSPLVPGTHGCLAGTLGKQDFSQVGLLADLRQRMARGCLREASYQVQGLWQPATDPTIGCRPTKTDERLEFLLE